MNTSKKTIFSGLLISALMLASCQGGKEKAFGIENCPVIAERVVTSSGDTVVVCDIALAKDTLVLPLSSLCADFEIIDLEEEHDDALVAEGTVYVSEHYIGFNSPRAGGYKLFDKTGKFLCTVSSRGGGPQEYAMFIYDSYIDEPNNRIYLLPMMSQKILVFDLQGNFQSSIPLAYSVGKAKFQVDSQKQQLLIAVLPFPDTPSVIWVQDFQGNIIQAFPSGHHVVEHPDFSNEVDMSLNTNFLDFSLFHMIPENDTLYHYDEAHNILRPVFTATFKGDIEPHSYIELPSQYLITLYSQSKSGDYFSQYLLVDKQTLRGSYVKLELDMLGGILDPEEIFFRRGYYAAYMYAYQLKAQLETALSSKSLTPEIREKLQKLNDSLHEDDNNVILIGKLKQGNNEIRLHEKGANVEIKTPETVSQQEEKENVPISTSKLQETVTSNEKPAGNTTNDEDNKVYRGWDGLKLTKRQPQFIDKDYMRKNNKYKDWDIADKKEVKLKFIAEKDGTTSNVEILESCGNKDLDNEAIRLIQNLTQTTGLNMKNKPIRIEMLITVYFPPLQSTK